MSAWKRFPVVSRAVYFALQEYQLPVTGFMQVYIDCLHFRSPLRESHVRYVQTRSESPGQHTIHRFWRPFDL